MACPSHKEKAVFPAQAGISHNMTRPPFSRGIRSVFVLFFFCLFFAACGFRPLYQNTNTLTGGVSALNDIWIATIPDASGLELRNALVDRFYHRGIPEDPHYHLKIVLRERARDLVIEKNSVTTRSQLVITADYKLIETATGRTIESGSQRAASSYNNLSSQYTTVVTQNQARHQVLSELSDKITMRMAVVMGE